MSDHEMTAAPDPRVPASYPRRILVASLGLAPQILTETLYCLGRPERLNPGSGERPFVPTEIHVVTTDEGRERANRTLLCESAMLAALEADYGLAGIAAALKPENIHVIRDADGACLPDIDSERDNAATADLMVALLRALTADPASALHVSIAGGRKTMGFLLGYALSLFARPQDRLSHVLVSKPFESHPKFFYPPPEPVVLHDQAGQPHSTAKAQLILANIPIVRLRDGLPRGMFDQERSYSETVAAAQVAIASPELVVDFSSRSFLCGGKNISLEPMTFAFATWLAWRATRLGPDEAAVHWSQCDWNEFLAVYAELPGQNAERVRKTRQRIAGDGADDFFREQVSRLRRALRDALDGGAAPYDLHDFGRKPMTRIGFALPAAAMTILGMPEPHAAGQHGCETETGRP